MTSPSVPTSVPLEQPLANPSALPSRSSLLESCKSIMKAQSKTKAPEEFYDIKIDQAKLSIEELFVYVGVDAKLGLKKMRTPSLSPKKNISKKSKNTKGKSLFFFI